MYTTNQEIIQDIESREDKVWFEYTTEWHENNRQLEIKEIKRTIPIDLQDWQQPIHDKSGNDSFETNLLGFSGQYLPMVAQTWDDLKCLNASLYEMVEQLTPMLATDSQEAEDALRKYLTNFEIIQVALGSTDFCTRSQPSKLAELQAHQDTVNEALGCIASSIESLPSEPKYYGSSMLSVVQWRTLQEWHGSLSLMYRMTRDGADFADLAHQIKTDIGGEIVIVFKCEKGYIFGLNVSLFYGTFKTEGMFTLVNPHGIEPCRLSENGNKSCPFLNDVVRNGASSSWNERVSSGAFHTNEHSLGSKLFTNFDKRTSAGAKIAEMEIFHNR